VCPKFHCVCANQETHTEKRLAVQVSNSNPADSLPRSHVEVGRATRMNTMEVLNRANKASGCLMIPLTQAPILEQLNE